MGMMIKRRMSDDIFLVGMGENGRLGGSWKLGSRQLALVLYREETRVLSDWLARQSKAKLSRRNKTLFNREHTVLFNRGF